MKLAVGAVVLALGATGITVTTLPRPPFPGPVASAPAAKRLVVVSSRKISPGLGSPEPGIRDSGERVCGERAVGAFRQGNTTFFLYGRDSASARCLVAFGRSGSYAFDFKNYVWPPRIRPGERGFVYEEILWAREANGVLYVSNGHLTYAKSSYEQNAYVTAIYLKTRKRLWRSKALVSNARTFAVTPDYLVTGYGFTAEPDWLYLLDRRTGRVVERLALPSAPERITRKGSLFTVRTYDHVLTVRLRGS